MSHPLEKEPFGFAVIVEVPPRETCAGITFSREAADTVALYVAPATIGRVYIAQIVAAVRSLPACDDVQKQVWEVRDL